MGRATYRCERCGIYVPFKKGKKHRCNSPPVKPSLSDLTHEQLLDYYALNPDEIEKGLTIVYRRYPLYKSRIDFIATDSKRNVCLIHIKHRSHRINKHYERKLIKQRGHLKQLLSLILHTKQTIPTLIIRLLLVIPEKPVIDFT